MLNRECLINKLQTTSRFVRTNLAQDLQKEGIYPGQDSVLLILAEKGDLTVGQLADELDVRPPTITKTILRLCNHGFVAKNTCKEDQRQNFVSLTQKGASIVERLQSYITTIEQTALSGINNEEAHLLSNLLARIEKNLE